MAHILPAFEAVVRSICLLATSHISHGVHVPESTRQGMQPHDLTTMIVGEDDVDVARWRQLSSGDYAGDEVVSWFWEHMEACSAAERIAVLQWTTGYNRLPYHTSDKYVAARGVVTVKKCDTFCLHVQHPAGQGPQTHRFSFAVHCDVRWSRTAGAANVSGVTCEKSVCDAL
jgi:hypothetical protein